MATKKLPADAPLANLLRRTRIDAGISQSAVARRAGCTRAMISYVEAAERRPNASILHAYLHISGRGTDMRRRDLLIAAAVAAGITGLPEPTPPVDPLRLAHEWLVDDQPLTRHRSAGDRIGTSLLTELEQRMIDLRIADDTMSGQDLFPIVMRDLAAATEAAQDCSYSDHVGRRLGRIIAELHQLAGWITFNFADYQRSERIYTDGADMARRIGDDTMVAWMLSGIAYQKVTTGDIADLRDARLLANSAIAGLRNPTPKVAILLHERAAWAAAAAGDQETTLRSLGTVAELHQRSAEDEPHWVYWLNPVESEIMAGRCLTRIGRPHEAVPQLEAAIATYPDDHVRELALYRSYLGEALARAGETEAAIAQYERSLATGAGAARVQRRLGELRQLIER